MIRQGTWLGPFGTGRHAPIAAEDQARVIAGILENPKAHAGKTYPLFGPVECDHKEISQIIGRVLGKEIHFEQVSIAHPLRHAELVAALGFGPRLPHGALHNCVRGHFAQARAEHMP
jgi:NAD(P)H dehydrogenase (quinone)